MAIFSVKNLLTLVQKRFHSTSSPLLTAENLINSCGLSSKSSLSISQKLKLDDENNLQNAQSVIDYLKSNGVDKTQIAKLIGKCPRILLCGVENNLKPKLEYFVRSGFTGTRLVDLFVFNPNIIYGDFYDEIKPAFEFLKELVGRNDDDMKAMTRCVLFVRGDLKEIMKSNVDFLIKEGVPVGNLSKLVSLNPISVMKNPDTFVHDVNAVKDLGILPQTLGFIRALRMMIQMTKTTLSKKIEMFKSLGWTEDEVLSMFRRSPFIFSCSEEKIRKNLTFLVDTVEVDPEYVIANPILLTYSGDRVCRRYKVLKVLESKDLLEWDKDNHQVDMLVRMSEKNFVDNYVVGYEKKVPGLLKMYSGTSKAKKIDKSMTKNVRVLKLKH